MPSDLETLMEAMAQSDRSKDEAVKLDLSSCQESGYFYSSVRPPKGARVKFTPSASVLNSLASSKAK